MIRYNSFNKLYKYCRNIHTISYIPTKNTTITAISFAYANKNDRVCSLPLCDHLFIKGCDLEFITNIILYDKYPKLKNIGIHCKTDDYTMNSIISLSRNKNYNLIKYCEISDYYMIYYNSFIKVGIKKYK